MICQKKNINITELKIRADFNETKEDFNCSQCRKLSCDCLKIIRENEFFEKYLKINFEDFDKIRTNVHTNSKQIIQTLMQNRFRYN